MCKKQTKLNMTVLLKRLLFVLMCVCLISIAQAEIVISNGDFETGAPPLDNRFFDFSHFLWQFWFLFFALNNRGLLQAGKNAMEIEY